MTNTDSETQQVSNDTSQLAVKQQENGNQLDVQDHLKRAPTPPPPLENENISTASRPNGNSASQQQQPKQIKQILKPPSEHRSNQRKTSVVNFQEECKYHEIDLERNRKKRGQPDKPAALISVRYYIMMLALVSPFVVTYSKTIINFAIIDMIHPDFVAQKSNSNNGTSAQQQQQLQTEAPASNTTAAPATELPPDFVAKKDLASYDLDNSCPVSQDDRERLERERTANKKRAHDRPGEKFEWDTVKQGMLKGAYSIGHSLCSVIGGRLAETFGSHRVMGLSALLIGSSCLLAPFFASIHFYLLFGDLMLLGILGSFMTPSLITLFANWLTPSEKSMMISFYLVSSRLGYALSALLCGLLIDAQLSWTYLFYSAGWVSFVFAVLFMLLSRSQPSEHPFISQLELDYLASKNTLVRESLGARKSPAKNANGQQTENSIEMKTTMANNDSHTSIVVNKPEDDPKDCSEPNRDTKKKKSSAPWFAILTSVPVWAFIITKFCVKLAGDTVQTELPTYLSRVMHFSPKDNGFINSSNYVIFCLSCLLVGGLAKTANKRRPFGWSKTAIRKLFQATASFGVCIVLLGISFSTCNNTMTRMFLMFMFFFTTFGTGGEAQIPLDISERYAGTIHAIGSSLAVSGAIEPILVGFLLRGHAADQNSWSTVWFGASAIAAFGGVVFLIFGDASKQHFDLIDPTTGEIDSQAVVGEKEKIHKGGDEQQKVSDNKDVDGKQKSPVNSENVVSYSSNESDQI